jgi:hypothetical protein
MSDVWRWTYRGITFRVSCSGASRGYPLYVVRARQKKNVALGWVKLAHLDRQGIDLEGLVFAEGHAWLKAALASAPSSEAGWTIAVHWQQGWTVESFALAGSVLLVLPDAATRSTLAAWIISDYQCRLASLVHALAAGVPESAGVEQGWDEVLRQEAEIAPDEDPTPAELVEALHLVEAGAAESAKAQARKRRWQARQARLWHEHARWLTWVKAHLSGLVPTSIFPLHALSLEPEVAFATSGCGVAVSYEALVEEGRRLGYLETCGERWLAYVAQQTALSWYAQHWQQERSPQQALWVLALLLSPQEEAEEMDWAYLRWVLAEEGEEPLVALAQSAAPIEVPWRQLYPCALASKVYRIPLVVNDSATRWLGYGIPRLPGATGPQALPSAAEQAEVWQRARRLYGWVELGQEAQGDWPRPSDLALSLALHPGAVTGPTHLRDTSSLILAAPVDSPRRSTHKERMEDE